MKCPIQIKKAWGAWLASVGRAPDSFFFKFIHLLFLRERESEREREREREHKQERDRERERSGGRHKRPKQAPGSELSAQSPMRGSNS